MILYSKRRRHDKYIQYICWMVVSTMVLKHYLMNEQIGLQFNIEWSGKASLRKCHLIKNL